MPARCAANVKLGNGIPALPYAHSTQDKTLPKQIARLLLYAKAITSLMMMLVRARQKQIINFVIFLAYH